MRSCKYWLIGLAITLLHPLNVSPQIQKVLKDASKEDFASYQNLSHFLGKTATNEEKKARLIHSWITTYVSLDPKLLFDEGPSLPPTADEVYQRGKTNSYGFAALFQAMLIEAGIDAEMVQGYSRKYDSDSNLFPAFCDHVWTAMKINNEWKLADPSMDAGYIGHKRTKKIERVSKMKGKHKKKFDRKMHGFYLIQHSDRDEEFKTLSKKREIRTKQRFTLEKNRTEEKAEKMRDFTKKVIFQRWPREQFFLISPDSFLLTHFPADPRWQLRDDTISLNLFLKGPEEIRKYLTLSKQNNFDHELAIGSFTSLHIESKKLEEALTSLKTNARNKKTMAEVSYMILRDKYVSNSFKKSDKIDLADGNFLLIRSLRDTSLKYVEMSEKFENIYFKGLESFYRKQDKETAAMSERQKKMIEKSLAWNQNASREIEHSWEYMERDLNKWRKIESKLYPREGVIYKADSFDLSRFPSIYPIAADSLKKLYEAVNESRETWCGRVEKSALNDIMSIQNSQLSLLRKNASFLRFKTFSKNSVLHKSDKLFNDYFDQVELLYTVSLKEEMYCDDYVRNLTNFYKYVKIISDELQATDKKYDPQCRSAIGVLDGYLQFQCHRFLFDLNNAALHFYWLKNELEVSGEQWEKLISSCERQATLNEEKMQFLYEVLTARQRREENTLFMMKSDLKRWKAFFEGSNQGELVVD